MRPAGPGSAQQVTVPRNVLILTLALAAAEKNCRYQQAELPLGCSGPSDVLPIQAGTASAFQAFAYFCAIAYISERVGGVFNCMVLQASSATAGCAILSPAAIRSTPIPCLIVSSPSYQRRRDLLLGLFTASRLPSSMTLSTKGLRARTPA